MPKVRFEIPAYVAATTVGSVVMAILWSVMSGLNLPGPGVLLVAFFGFMFSLPTMLFMMPASLAGIWLANRFGWQQHWQFVAYGATSSLITAAAVLPFSRLPDDLTVSWPAVSALAFSGGVAGLTYRVTLRRYRHGGPTLI